MPLLQAYERPSLTTDLDSAPFVIAIAGEAPSGELHAGSFATTEKAWAILAAPFVDDPCNGLGAQSCCQAMALRALKNAIDKHLLPKEGSFTLVTDNLDLACLLINWQSGADDIPHWYRRRGRRSTVVRLQRNVTRIGRRMAIRHLPVMSLPPVGEAARALAAIGLRYLRGEISPTDQFDEGQLVMRESGL